MNDVDGSHFLGTRGKPGPGPVLLSAQQPPMPEDTQPVHFTFLFILHIFIGANSGGRRRAGHGDQSPTTRQSPESVRGPQHRPM